MRLKHVYRLRTRAKGEVESTGGAKSGTEVSEAGWVDPQKGCGKGLGLPRTQECLRMLGGACASGPGGVETWGWEGWHGQGTARRHAHRDVRE